jgi:hypothetical protein
MAWGRRSLVVLAAALAGCGRVGFDDQPPGDGAPVPTVGFAFAQSLTDEAAGTHAVGIVLSEPAMSTVTVEVGVTGGDADPNADFVLGATRVTLLPGETQADLLVTIFADGIEEPDETIELTLGAAINARVGRAAHKVTISGSILPRVQFAAEGSSADENDGTQSFGVVLDVMSSVDVVVSYDIDGTSSAADHELAAGQLVIPAGQLTAPITGAIVDDPYDEENETLVLGLTAQTGAVIGAVPTHVHTIIDQDPPPTVGFDVQATAVPEDTINALEVTLSIESEKTVTVGYTSTGSASDTDFTATPETLVFPPGVTQAFINGVPTADVLDEENELASFTLIDPTNATIRAAAGTHNWTIIDNDEPPALQFQTATASVPEGATYTPLVQLSGPSGRTVQFSVALALGTASSTDVAVNTGPYTIPPGSTTIAVNVSLIQDASPEPDETFTLQVAGAVNATLGAPAQLTVTIQNDD